MVCYQVAGGNADARRTTRDKHFILFDQPRDKGVALKTAFPRMGWATDIGGHPSTLPFSVGARLMLQAGAETNDATTLLFAEFPTAQLLDRSWNNIVESFDMSAVNPFKEAQRAAKAAEDATPFAFVAGDWEKVEGDLGEWQDRARWVDLISRRYAFGSDPTSGKSGIAGAEIFFYLERLGRDDLRRGAARKRRDAWHHRRLLACDVHECTVRPR